MQGGYRKAGRVKRQKLGSDESTTSVSATNDSANCDPDVNDFVIGEPTFCDSIQLEQYIDASTYNEGMAMLDKYYRTSPVDSGRLDGISAFDTLPISESALQDGSLSTHHPSPSQARSHQHPLSAPRTPRIQDPDRALDSYETNNATPSEAIEAYKMTRGTLDKSGHYLADILKALEDANNTSHIPNSNVLSVSKHLLAESASINYVKIITNPIVNYFKFNRKTTKPALNIKQEQLCKFKSNKLKRITKD
jgi:hypothetical protein